ncbi:hypothetical protein Patl1_14928 [Pistacia atlantica]|uniref:Uncharacterized protein n=1 Tax=Pistacia atlantica TaxID=434234 RepID=A0ACC1B5G8_9ROSI|nr:hypothetical protein Patl1_14928 [Pistacia atlantica]
MEPSWRLLTPPRVPNLIGGRSVDSQSFPSWRNTLVTTCQRIMFKFQELIWRDMDKLAMNITTEHGKTLEDAPNDVLHGLVEHACGLETLQIGEYFFNVSNGIDSCSIREPLGVCCGICYFDFPAMIPSWVSLPYLLLLWPFNLELQFTIFFLLQKMVQR